jgi:hypothetical protein
MGCEERLKKLCPPKGQKHPLNFVRAIRSVPSHPICASRTSWFQCEQREHLTVEANG